MIGSRSCVFFDGSCEDVGCRSCPEVRREPSNWEGCKGWETRLPPRVEGCDITEPVARAFTDDPDSSEVDLFMTIDNVQHPPHYARWKMEPIEFIAINDLPWWLANVVKYCMRFDAKDGLQDLYKARSYLEMKIRECEGEERFWDKPVAQERALKEKM